MGKLSEEVHQQCHPHNIKIKLLKPTKNPMKKKPMKITYISSPVIVRATTPCEFRALVQELTGKDSDVDRVVLPPHDNEELGPVFIRESGLTSNVPAAHSGWTSNLPSQWHTPTYDRSIYSLYMEEAFVASNNPTAIHGFGLDESFLCSDSSEGFYGFQPSQCFNMIKELV